VRVGTVAPLALLKRLVSYQRGAADEHAQASEMNKASAACRKKRLSSKNLASHIATMKRPGHPAGPTSPVPAMFQGNLNSSRQWVSGCALVIGGISI
jgi:hypothetical protein